MVQFGLASLRPCGRRRARVAAGSFLLLLGSTLGQTGTPPPGAPLSAAPATGPGEFSGIPWESLETPPPGLAAVRQAATIESRTDRAKALQAIADDPAMSARVRAAASYRLGADALRRGRWSEAEKRLTAPELSEGPN